MPVDLYVGGAEHAVLHLLYARFWHKVLYDIGAVNTPEPFKRLINQGLITSFAYQRPNKSLVPVDEVEEAGEGRFIEKATGEEVEQVIAKMSKSLKNVINPDEIIEEFGADSMRMYEMFMGPLQVSKPWQTNGLMGVHRFLDRVWRAADKPLSTEAPPEELLRVLHKTIKKVSSDTDKLEFNTAISQMMIFINEQFKSDFLYKPVWEKFLLLLAPYAPHIAEELWEKLGNPPSVGKEAWPDWDEALTIEDELTIVVQVNGKLRDKVDLPRGTDKKALEETALGLEKIKAHTEGKTIVKVITVPDKLVNIVVR
jgi:leucyl-tRNA synthetase